MAWQVSPAQRAAGIALIVAPLVGIALKLFSFGWLMVLILMGPVLVLVLGYALQVAIAARGFLSARDSFGSRAKLARRAAWLTSGGFVLLCTTMIDGGDGPMGSTLQVWLGAHGPNADAVHATTDALTSVLAWVGAAAWLGGFVWLVIEWIVALRHRS